MTHFANWMKCDRTAISTKTYTYSRKFILSELSNKTRNELNKRLESLMDLTLAITWPQSVLGEEDRLAVAAQVHGGVS
jgi:hypothetical protein